MLSLRGPSSHLAFVVLSGDLYIKPKSRGSFFRSYQEAVLKELVMDEKVSRLQEVVNKGPCYSVEMIKQSMPIPLEQEGIKHAKLDKLPIGQNRRRYRVSYTLLLKLSLSSQFLSTTAPTINIGLSWYDGLLLFFMVTLLLFP